MFAIWLAVVLDADEAALTDALFAGEVDVAPACAVAVAVAVGAEMDALNIVVLADAVEKIVCGFGAVTDERGLTIIECDS